MAASAKIRNGIMIVLRKKSLPAKGIRANATTRIAAMPIRSWRIGKIA